LSNSYNLPRVNPSPPVLQLHNQSFRKVVSARQRARDSATPHWYSPFSPRYLSLAYSQKENTKAWTRCAVCDTTSTRCPSPPVLQVQNRSFPKEGVAYGLTPEMSQPHRYSPFPPWYLAPSRTHPLPLKCLWGLFVWGLLFLSCVCVCRCRGWCSLSVCVCACACDLLIFSHASPPHRYCRCRIGASRRRSSHTGQPRK